MKGGKENSHSKPKSQRDIVEKRDRIRAFSLNPPQVHTQKRTLLEVPLN
jgi:hypothetical protein